MCCSSNHKESVVQDTPACSSIGAATIFQLLRNWGLLPPCHSPSDLTLEELSTKVDQAREALWDLLRGWAEQDHVSTLFCYMIGIANPRRPQILASARKQVLTASAGLYRRLAIGLREFPMILWQLLSEKVSVESKRELAQKLLHAPQCRSTRAWRGSCLHYLYRNPLCNCGRRCFVYVHTYIYMHVLRYARAKHSDGR